MKPVLALLLFMALAGCSGIDSDARLIQSPAAVEMAAAVAPAGISGRFDVHVQATGKVNGVVFLNSENDYRDQRNLSVEIAPAVAEDLEKTYGAPPEHFFQGKHITVTGEAARVTVWFIDGKGVQTDKYYYQTHVRVDAPNQIQIVP